ncbi:transcriptional regulator [Mesorhizobium sanjuanii]|uniref:Transcriptional regulator n=1 Tax=Mesorhizobium sanjuanii TaxID=2037900 RepID=A0A2A6FE34_9HYPH|nr:transcriptional regulator [Mesorhizobium sanjuanii]PDQ20094.1 transcriptional regulator [Mesorhizobium sanjuanii]
MKDLDNKGYLRLGDVIGPGGLLPIGRSNWYARIAQKRAPHPVKCGRISLWKVQDIERLLRDPDGYSEAVDDGASK